MPRRKEYKSIKVPEETYEKLKSMGKGISEALTTLVEDKEKAIEKKMADIGDVAEDLAEELLKSGIFEIRFAGFELDDVLENGDSMVIKATVRVEIPDEQTRKTVIDVLKGKGGEKGG